MSSIIHLVRHGRIPDYKTDRSLTPMGRKEALAAGRQLAAQVRPDETIRFFSSPSRRARETAAFLRDGMAEGLARTNLGTKIIPVVAVDDRLQNFQFHFEGLDYEPITLMFDLVRCLQQQTGSSQYNPYVTFHTEFWSSSDPMRYWLTHPSKAAESPDSVAERLYVYITERFILTSELGDASRDICVTHAANLMAFLHTVFGDYSEEPPFCEGVTVEEGLVSYQGKTGKLSLADRE